MMGNFPHGGMGVGLILYGKIIFEKQILIIMITVIKNDNNNNNSNNNDNSNNIIK